MPCCPTQVSGGGVRMAGRRAGLCPRDLTPRPGTPEVDRPTWTVVHRPDLLEVVQHVLRAVGRPDRKKTMIVVFEGPAATDRDEPRIPDLGEDHQALPAPVSAKVIGRSSDTSAKQVEHLHLEDRRVIAWVAVDLPRDPGQRPVMGDAPLLDGGVGAGQLIGRSDVHRRRDVPGRRMRETRFRPRQRRRRLTSTPKSTSIGAPGRTGWW